jgi:hypothetical protein
MRSIIFAFVLILFCKTQAEVCKSIPTNHIQYWNGLTPLATKFTSKNKLPLSVFELKTWNAYSKLPCKGMFAATFLRHQKKITFIAVNPIHEPADPYTNKDLKKIENLIDSIQPTGLLIDKPSLDLLSDQDLEINNKNCYKGTNFICGTGVFAAMSARENDAIVMGSEPPPHIFEIQLIKRISYRDLLYFKGMQFLLELRKKGVPQKQWPEKFDDFIYQNARTDKDILSFDQFSEFLTKDIGTTPEKLHELDLNTTDYNNANILQKIAYMIDHTREPFTLKRLESLLNRSDNIAIVNSPVHYYIQQNVLSRAFGKPEIKCLD